MLIKIPKYRGVGDVCSVTIEVFYFESGGCGLYSRRSVLMILVRRAVRSFKGFHSESIFS